MERHTVRVTVPASTANLGPGFDTLGMAFQRYTWIEMSVADQTEIDLAGAELGDVPADKGNLLYQTAVELFRLAGLPVPELRIRAETEVPLARGLGSSAAAIVGSLAAANALAGEPFTREQLFAIASRMEGHPDNVGASLFGGIVVAAMQEDSDTHMPEVPYIRFLPPPSLKSLVIIPDFWLETSKARHVLPESYSKADLVHNVSRSSLLVAALMQGRLDLLAQAMQDRMHQPYRAALVPGLQEMLQEGPHHGALGVALSGAGPTTLFFYETEAQKQSLLAFATEIMAKYRISYRALELVPDTRGTTIEREQRTG